MSKRSKNKKKVNLAKDSVDGTTNTLNNAHAILTCGVVVYSCIGMDTSVIFVCSKHKKRCIQTIFST